MDKMLIRVAAGVCVGAVLGMILLGPGGAVVGAKAGAAAATGGGMA
jgi:hypothetical protein